VIGRNPSTTDDSRLRILDASGIWPPREFDNPWKSDGAASLLASVTVEALAPEISRRSFAIRSFPQFVAYLSAL
jgi:hypothetical protein